ncbi:thiolase domain-containing protein [Candidatus Woesearchaeota archaeon]|nr:thiolase domain-containing protein [Candidatus Woesearchaeota archaeon]
MRKVAIIGIGMTKFGNLWERDLVSLAVEAGAKACKDAGVDKDKIQAIYGGTMSGGLFVSQEHIGALLADYSGLKNIPSTRVEAACASGGLALRQAYLDIASGMHDLVVAGGVEKMTDIGGGAATNTLATAASQEWEAVQGATFPGLYAMIAKLHMKRYGTTERQMALCAVKNHKNALNNPNAQFRRQITVEGVMKSTRIADPVKLFDCSPISDGAASVVLASEKAAEKFSKNPVWIKASGHATDTLSLHDREDITTLKATVEAAKQAYSQANLKPADIDCVEVHDCFTIAEICAIEDLGFCKKGEGGKFVEKGNTKINGKIPVNTSGGLKAKGHPIGASGIAQAIEAVLQLRRHAKGRQVDTEYAMTHNVGGTGATAVVHIFGREK